MEVLWELLKRIMGEKLSIMYSGLQVGEVWLIMNYLSTQPHNN